MRPLRLEVEGFAAFRQPAVVDFEGADLFALVGPTGSGKTSLLDAITFALYGSVPRLDDRRAVAPVISQNLTEARLRLDFAVGQDTYTAVRIVRASRTGASTKEARLERAGEVLAGAADEVADMVTDLLGLTYEHFTTCVSLPQGQFARFLHDKPRDRQDLLVRLLELGIYDKVASAARQQAMLAAADVDVLGGQLERLAAATPERLATARSQVAQLAALAARLTEARPELDRLVEDERAANAEVERCAHQLTALRELRAPEGVAELSQALGAAATERTRCAEAEEAAAHELTVAEQQLAALPPRAELEQVQRDLARRVELDELVAKGEEAAREASASVQRHQQLEADAEAERERSAHALERLRVERRAQALVPELRLGEACPVCHQTVETLPEGHPDHQHSTAQPLAVVTQELSDAETALARAEAGLKAAARHLSDARTHEARVDEKLTSVRQEIAEIDTRLAEAVIPTVPGQTTSTAVPTADAIDAPGPSDGGDATAAVAVSGQMSLVDVMDAGAVAGDRQPQGASVGAAEVVDAVDRQEAVDRPEIVARRGGVDLMEIGAALATVDTAEAAVERARQADRAARTARAAADRRYDDLTAQEAAAWRVFDLQRDALAVLEPPSARRDDLAADWQALVAWADQRRPTLEDELARQRDLVAGARRRADDQLDELVAACRDAGVTVDGRSGDRPVWPGEAVAAAHARADEEVQRIEAALAEAETLRQRVRQATEERQVADTLAAHLAANRFEKWLLDEAMHRLVAGATTILSDLTASAYALSVDRRTGGFTVIDHANASQPRPARTLSGGETFLASLALALALADQVADLAAGGAARLESLFLDEGFGTLDADTLDVVATALDELGARGRLVGVVTHVRELAERLPVRFEVRKVGGSSTVERVEA